MLLPRARHVPGPAPGDADIPSRSDTPKPQRMIIARRIRSRGRSLGGWFLASVARRRYPLY